MPSAEKCTHKHHDFNSGRLYERNILYRFFGSCSSRSIPVVLESRGLMARYAVTQRISQPADLLGFDLDGYRHAAEASTPERLVFRRRLAD